MNASTAYQKKIDDINTKFEQSHLVYLQTDDSPLKLDLRRKLEELVEEYLCLVPHDSKFIFSETADIFHWSLTNLEGTYGYKACAGWSAISLYASNLLSQPWRKEYRKIEMYGGFYKHEVGSNLINAHKILQLMGYSFDNENLLVLRGPIDPDRVSSVSRDAIVASIESKIIDKIWKNLPANNNITWHEVLDFRKNYAGSPEQAIRALSYRHSKDSVDFWLGKHETQYFNNMKIRHFQESGKVIPNHVNATLVHSDQHSKENIQHRLNLNQLKKLENISRNGLPGREEFRNNSAAMQNSFRCEKKIEEMYSDPEIITEDKFDKATNFTESTFLVEKQEGVVFYKSRDPSSENLKDLPDLNYKTDELNRESIDINQHCEINNWSCPSCTFQNQTESSVCEMCGKSRMKGNECEPLISGGKECPTCTLINEKNVIKCDVCNTNLENSPTYI